ncbi:NAD(P)H-dependent oxidoreductase subunit E [Sulfidibacter corallicola]|uniref:NAD(P)H-dependent oxidoreductase subunit E n=1 Tax=Sulfidibacter corallicola TaxID=2818388 RepID=A0A8A4TRH0_SULCO|nr:NAD(P)H-dependent oxidoreductase subunit E [Sulfidibacter corallicola]QTD52566.1 NAD(P)H-dependent oxidoreductase subunit E [Sulfidibacter corallicola]
MERSEQIQRLDRLVAGFSKPQSALLEVLHALRAWNRGQVPDTMVEDIARCCDLPVTRVRQVVAVQDRAADLTDRPRVCVGLTCYLHGGRDILEASSTHPVLPREQVAWAPSPCLGHCYAAPVARLADGRLVQLVRQGDWSQASAKPFAV